MLPVVDAIEAAQLRGSFDRDATAAPYGDASPPTTGASSCRDGGGRDGSIVPELVAAYDQGRLSARKSPHCCLATIFVTSACVTSNLRRWTNCIIQ